MFQVRFHGRGGQGVVTAAELLAEAAFIQGRHAQAFPSFGSERMGAPVMSFCRIAERPIGWGSSPADTIKVARLATESGLFPVFEAETGQVVSSTPIRHRVPVTDYLRIQARYAHLFRPAERTEVIAKIQAAADRNIARFGLMPDTISAERAMVPVPATAETSEGEQ
jgi:hypothetical protein